MRFSSYTRVVTVFGAAHPHHAYLFANRRANRMKVLVHDGFGIWLAARRLHEGHFIWPNADNVKKVQISEPQLQALVLGLPWHRIGESAVTMPELHLAGRWPGRRNSKSIGKPGENAGVQFALDCPSSLPWKSARRSR